MPQNVPSISLKRLGAQVVGLNDTPDFYLDLTGHEADVLRGREVRSLRRLTRQTVGTADLTLQSIFLRTSQGLAIEAIRSGTIASAANIINAIRDAITTAVTLVGANDPSNFAPTVSVKKLLSALTFLDDGGKFVLDDLGGVNTDGFARLGTARSARQNMRRLMKSNGDAAPTLRINTAAGLVTRQISADAPATAGAFQTSVQVLAGLTSTSATTKATLPAAARTTSLLLQLIDLIVVATDGTLAIDDTGETNSTRANGRTSLLREVKRLVQSNVDTDPTFRLQTTSGIKWKKVADLDPGTASVADIVSALTVPV